MALLPKVNVSIKDLFSSTEEIEIIYSIFVALIENAIREVSPATKNSQDKGKDQKKMFHPKYLYDQRM